MDLVRRISALLMVLLTALVAFAPAAGAHSVSGAGASNFRTALTALEPAVPGLELRVIEAGSRLELSNRTGRDVVVLGYEGEPYLRVGPDGVFTNRKSSATYLNANRKGNNPLPPDVDPKAPPMWDQIGTGDVARWHDHRTHWMGGQLPPEVRQHPDRRQLVGVPWTVELMQGSQKITASGTLEWVPPPSPVPWLALAIGLAGVTAWVAAKSRVWRLPAALLSGLVAVDVIHAAGLAAIIAGPLSTKLGKAASANALSIIAWLLAAVAVVLLVRGQARGRTIGLFGALIMLVAGGLFDVSYLSKTVLPFGFSANLGRLLVAATIGLGAGLVLGWLYVLFAPALRPPSPRATAPAASAGVATPTAP